MCNFPNRFFILMKSDKVEFPDSKTLNKLLPKNRNTFFIKMSHLETS